MNQPVPKEPDSRKVIRYLWTTKRVAKYFNVTEATVRLWVNQGVIQSYRIPDDEADTVPAHTRRGPLYFTDEAIRDRALVYYKLGD